jgi:hypothetical protein
MAQDNSTGEAERPSGDPWAGEPWAKIPERLLIDESITPTAKVLYALLYMDLNWKTLRGTTSLERLAARLGLSSDRSGLNQVSDYLKKLAEAGYLRRERTGKTNRYELLVGPARDSQENRESRFTENPARDSQENRESPGDGYRTTCAENQEREETRPRVRLREPNAYRDDYHKGFIDKVAYELGEKPETAAMAGYLPQLIWDYFDGRWAMNNPELPAKAVGWAKRIAALKPVPNEAEVRNAFTYSDNNPPTRWQGSAQTEDGTFAGHLRHILRRIFDARRLSQAKARVSKTSPATLVEPTDALLAWRGASEADRQSVEAHIRKSYPSLTPGGFAFENTCAAEYAKRQATMEQHATQQPTS